MLKNNPYFRYAICTFSFVLSACSEPVDLNGLEIEPSAFFLQNIERESRKTGNIAVVSWSQKENLEYIFCVSNDAAESSECVEKGSVKNHNKLKVPFPLGEFYQQEAYIVSKSVTGKTYATNTISVDDSLMNTFIQEIKSENPVKNGVFGNTVSVGDMGELLAVGSPATNSVNIYRKKNHIWKYQQSVMLKDTGLVGVNLSQDGNILAVTTHKNIYVYKEAGNTFDSNGQKLLPTDLDINSAKYSDLALNSDGSVIILGVPKKNFVQIFREKTVGHVLEIDLPKLDPSKEFGTSVAINGIGNRVFVGAKSDSNSEGYGSVYIFDFSKNGQWNQKFIVKNPDSNNSFKAGSFGKNIAVDKSGETIIVSATQAVHQITFSNDAWEIIDLKPEISLSPLDNYGDHIEISPNGEYVVVGNFSDPRNSQLILPSAAGVAQYPPNDYRSGSVRVFRKKQNQWALQAFIKPSFDNPDRYFGQDADVSDAGEIFIGSPHNSSGSAGVNGNINQPDVLHSGAVFIY